MLRACYGLVVSIELVAMDGFFGLPPNPSQSEEKQECPTGEENRRNDYRVRSEKNMFTSTVEYWNFH